LCFVRANIVSESQRVKRFFRDTVIAPSGTFSDGISRADAS
jgi:hypothetical protein